MLAVLVAIQLFATSHPSIETKDTAVWDKFKVSNLWSHTAVSLILYAVDKGIQGQNILQPVAIDSATYTFAQDQFTWYTVTYCKAVLDMVWYTTVKWRNSLLSPQCTASIGNSVKLSYFFYTKAGLCLWPLTQELPVICSVVPEENAPMLPTEVMTATCTVYSAFGVKSRRVTVLLVAFILE